MSSMSSASSDAPVDLEKGAAGVKAAAATKAANPRVALCVMLLLDACAVFSVLLFIGLFTWMVSVSNNWWDPWPSVVIILPLVVIGLWSKPKTSYCMKPAPESDDSDLSSKLLASEI